MQKWEVWLAKVAFEDNPSEAKERPVLVIDKKEAYIISFKMTSQKPREKYFGEYPIQFFHEAGLIKPTVIRLSKKLALLEDEFIRKLGRLHPYDINEVIKILNNL